MKLHIVDILIICAYLMVIVAIGLFLKKKAAKNMDSYFLGGKSLPFYMLGLSNASGMFDITGTMLMVYWAFAYGFKSLWIPWLWPVFNQIFLMVYLSVWLRRSNVLTGAEWIKTQHIKRQRLSAQKIRIHILCRLLFQKQPQVWIGRPMTQVFE